MTYANMMRPVIVPAVDWAAGRLRKNGRTAHFHASDVTGEYAQADFHLTDHNGKPRSLSDFRGKVVVLFFGYTHCPDVCPTTLAGLAQTLRLLGKDADRVQVLFVTIDPERDTRELLAKFVPAFDPSFLGLYGDAQATAEAAKNFRVSYQKHPDQNRLYDGSFDVQLPDRHPGQGAPDGRGQGACRLAGAGYPPAVDKRALTGCGIIAMSIISISLEKVS